MKKDNFCLSAAPRIAEERDRLGFTQEQIATACGVSRVMWGKYERGLAAMGGEYLFSFAAQGADINYILTGVRIGEIKFSPEIPLTITREEAALLDNYRHCPPDGQAAIKATSAALAQSSKKLKKFG